MFKTMNNIRKKRSNKKGFTLVELIVVIVIILILAAVLVPNLLKYVDRANQANCKSDAASALSQLQADYADSQTPDGTALANPYTAIPGVSANTATSTIVTTDTAALALAKGSALYHVATSTNGYGTIDSFAYSNGKYVAIWTGNAWTVSKKTA